MKVTEETVHRLLPLWLVEFVQGPKLRYQCWPIFFSRGYTFHTFDHGQDRTNMNYGVCVQGGEESEFYGLLEEIIMVEYHGAVNLRTILFRCAWFDPTVDRGVRKHNNRVIDINYDRRYNKNEPFILPDQADQVCYIPYPQIPKKGARKWRACIKVIARGIREDPEVTTDALQDDDDSRIVTISDVLEVTEHAVAALLDDELDDPPVRDENSDDQFDSEVDDDTEDSDA